MCKITKLSVQALYSFRSFKSGNTRVDVANHADKSQEAWMFLHGNKIAGVALVDGRMDLEITTAGWNTRTTFDRLNGLPGVRVTRKNWSVYLNDVGWDGEWITVGTPAAPLPHPVAAPFDLGQAMLRYEDGELDHEGVLELFQHIVNSGTVNHLQGSYGRTAHHLIAEGLISVS